MRIVSSQSKKAMAPDRGTTAAGTVNEPMQVNNAEEDDEITALEDDSPHRGRKSISHAESRDEARNALASRASQPQNFTLRGILVGLAIGIGICFSNTYFGLQTGWISGMSMPASLVGFSFFRALGPRLRLPFSPVENVLVQTVAGSVGTMPLGCGFVGVIPALEFLLKKDENGPLSLSLAKLAVWAVGVCLFGVVFAVPLRREVIIREKLKFPSGTATALLIGVLHGDKKEAEIVTQQSESHEDLDEADEERMGLMRAAQGEHAARAWVPEPVEDEGEGDLSDWQAKIKLMTMAFSGSAAYTLISYFVPQFHNIPIFGLPLSTNWLWALNPSPAYVGQGIIMGPATTIHMLLGAVFGWGVLSPLAKSRGWASGPVSDWETGSKGWIVWASLAIMLGDSIVSLGWLIARLLIKYGRLWAPQAVDLVWNGRWSEILNPDSYADAQTGYTSLESGIKPSPWSSRREPEADAPPEHLVSSRALLLWLTVSLALYVACTYIAFPSILPFSSVVLALVLSLILSIMGVRALGETDLNPVSGISKLTQLIFAAIIPRSNPNAVPINLIAGAISESGALQAGDLMQDLKCGHLLGASPAAQFYGQIIGSVVGAVVSAAVYKLYTSVYEVPGGQFQVPTAYVWVFTARLVTGKGLPPMAWQYAAGTGLIFCVTTAVRTMGQGRWWHSYVPGGIAVAVGMYNTPSFTLARTVGGLIHWWWCERKKRDETPVVVLASGLILGEGLFSIVNLGMASLKVPHL